MASNLTPNFRLSLWAPEDKVSHEEFNEDHSKIDAALKAEADARVSLAGQVSQKASQSALSSETSTRASAISSLTNQVNKKGNCQIYYSSYVGDGVNTRSRTLTFPSRPLMVFVMGSNIILRAIQGASYAMCKTSGEGGAACPASWSGNSLTWTGSSVWSASEICNAKDVTHYVVAFMDMS